MQAATSIIGQNRCHSLPFLQGRDAVSSSCEPRANFEGSRWPVVDRMLVVQATVESLRLVITEKRSDPEHFSDPCPSLTWKGPSDGRGVGNPAHFVSAFSIRVEV